MNKNISYWNVKVYNNDGAEHETIRRINTVTKDTLMQVFDRENIQAQSMAYTDDGKAITEKGESVNWPRVESSN